MLTASLQERTHALLVASDRSLPEIYKDTGISFYWLRKFKSGKIKDPSVNTVERLYTYLTGKPLDLE